MEKVTVRQLYTIYGSKLLCDRCHIHLEDYYPLMPVYHNNNTTNIYSATCQSCLCCNIIGTARDYQIIDTEVVEVYI